MATRNILTDEDPKLRKISREVKKFNPRLHTLLDDMKETLIGAQGVGLAAPQVGILKRVFIIIEPETEKYTEVINPEFLLREGEQDFEEGCLSVPGYRGNTKRPAKVKVRVQDRHGKSFEIIAETLLAVALCHENDHLDGILYTDIVQGDLWTVDE